MTVHNTIVSLAIRMTVALALCACVHPSSRPPVDGQPSVEWYPLAIRFDNDDRDRVHVYLVSDRHEWLLGRVEPGARATLRIPEASLAEGVVRVAVISAERLTLRASLDPRTVLTVAAPVSAIVSQRWMFAQGQLMSMQVAGGRVDVSGR